jgi:hypothetical protein
VHEDAVCTAPLAASTSPIINNQSTTTLFCSSVPSCVQVRVSMAPKDPRVYGKWAIVTGATAGIGEAFAYELAAAYVVICDW